MITLKELKSKISADTYSIKKGVITLRRGYFYRKGKTADTFVNDVKSRFPTARIIDSGDVWKDFRGGASVANSSHWFVKFTLDEGD